MKRLYLLLFMIGVLATANAQLRDVNNVIDNTPDSIGKALMARPAPGSTRKGSLPVLFLVGNSTMRNGTLGNGNNGQWGWGYFFPQYFDANKISVENQALGGMSTRTFYTDLWPAIRKALQPGDWVIVSIGHNDGGEYFDQRRARAVIPGIDLDTCIVGFNQRTQRQDTVYSYGTYLKKYIGEIRAKGAHTILMSLTPRNAYDNNGKIVRKPQTDWARAIAKEEGVPFIDLNEISGAKLDSYSRWKVNYHFLGDLIHTSKFGAEMNAESAAMGIMSSNDPQLKSLKNALNVPIPQKYITTNNLPRVFLTGDSTVKNNDSDENGMWGWGAVANTVFNEGKCTVINAARAGRSTRSFIREGLWDMVYKSLQPGDYVLIQFGHNDISPITDQKARGVIAQSKDSLHVYQMDNGTYEVIYSFGWYLKKMIDDVREKGATPILLSLTPRNEWPGGKIERRNDPYGKWYREVVAETGVEFVDVHNITADALDKIGREGAKEYYNNDHTHTSKKGALLNAQSVAKGLKANKSPLAKLLK